MQAEERKQTFRKEERLNSRTTIERLFSGGSKSFCAFPLRAVYMRADCQTAPDAPASVLVNVSKRRLKHAVDRNRIKRQVREAYRRHKYLLPEAPVADGKGLVIAFLWLADELRSSGEVERKMKKILQHITEKLA